jgi:hypothetical protein
MMLATVTMTILGPKREAKFNTFITADETKELLRDRSFALESARLGSQWRHFGIALGFLAQDPKSITRSLYSVADIVAAGSMVSEESVTTLRRHCEAFEGLKAPNYSRLGRSRFLVWAKNVWAPDVKTHRLLILDVRPLTGHHGGATVQATAEAAQRTIYV